MLKGATGLNGCLGVGPGDTWGVFAGKIPRGFTFDFRGIKVSSDTTMLQLAGPRSKAPHSMPEGTGPTGHG